jgi:two-component system, cell cycle response regulator CpdR
MARGGDDPEICRLAFDQAPVALSLLDLTGHQVAANDAYLALFGLESDGILDVTAVGLTHPSDQERTTEYLDQLARGEISEIITEKMYVRSDGTIFEGRLAARPLVDENGTMVGILGVIRDLAEQEVFDRIERRLDVREEVGRVAAATAHELNNVLGAIALQLDLDGAATETLRSLVDRAERLGTDLLAISGDELRTSPSDGKSPGPFDELPAVLVVDDEPSLLDSVAQTLRRSGFEVHVASDGVEAIEVARGRRIGVLVTDLAMPNMDGVTLAERLREERPDLPVLFITGHAAVDLARRLPEDAPVLRKPFRALDLVSTVTRLVPSVN